jgi:hypothetical protein
MKNYGARKRRLDFDNLPQTFQDAIHITQALGYRYMWADSVCIVQEGDHGHDWENEAGNMADYYQRSVVTIAATGASQGVEGYLLPRHADSSGKLARLSYRDTKGVRKGFFYVHKRQGRVNLEVESTVRESSLMRKGWVFQEWVLSRGIIHYTPTQRFFECQTDYPSNEHQETIEPTVASTARKRKMALKTSLHYTTAGVYDLWCSLVQVYSELDLTFWTDRIAAIAGVAQESQDMMRSKLSVDTQDSTKGKLEYIAGLWLQEIHHGLLWQAEVPDAAVALQNRAPTWSWASIKGAVRWSDRETVSKACKVLNLISSAGVRYPLGRQIGEEAPNIEEYNTKNLYTCLHVLARIQPVWVSQQLQTKPAEQVGRWTGQKPLFQPWHGIYASERLEGLI